MKNKFGFLLLLACACNPPREKSSTSIDSLAASKPVEEIVMPDTVKKDKELDALGRYIAGLEQADSNSYSTLQKEAAWKTFKSTTDSSWNTLFTERLSKMQTWQADHFSLTINDSLRVFYPFSGPDFLHAYYLYPTAHEFVLVALEPIQEAVSLKTLDATSRDHFLDSLRHSLRSSFKKSFFETKNMVEDFKSVKGVLPLLYLLIERSGHELLQQQFIYIDTAGLAMETKFAKLYRQKIPAVRLKFRDRETKEISQLYYLNINMLSSELKKRPGFEKFLKRKQPFNTFIKSASYLMHRPAFQEIRRLIMDNSVSIFQDDTGIPYANFKGKLDWTMQFYGAYTKPIKLFETRYQPDLDSAYQASKFLPLPFSIGYHYKKDQASYMLAKKSSVKLSR